MFSGIECYRKFSSALGGQVLTVSAALLAICQAAGLPEIKVQYWGAGDPKPDDKSVRPFKIETPQSELDYLSAKLNLTRTLVPPLEGVNFQYGFNSNYLTDLVEYWKTKYDWRQREAYLNKYPQFKTQIGGLDIHFIHVKPSDTDAAGKTVLPLLLVHGWPGSVREFYEIIPLLTSARPDTDFVFEVVVPSIPGFGFSQASSKTGLAAPQVAAIFTELMTRLGHESFIYQGGDWGSIIGHHMAALFPNRMAGFHSNMCLPVSTLGILKTALAWLFPSMFVEAGKREAFKGQFFNYVVKEAGYYHIQATKPDTVGTGLSDSPAGLAAYILEKFSSGTKKGNTEKLDGGLSVYSKDDLLDNVMIYWLTNTITTSARIFKENFNKDTHSSPIFKAVLTVPTHCAMFPNEVFYFPEAVLKPKYKKLVGVTNFKVGGHFAAFEQPTLLADDVWGFVKKLRSPSPSGRFPFLGGFLSSLMKGF